MLKVKINTFKHINVFLINKNCKYEKTYNFWRIIRRLNNHVTIQKVLEIKYSCLDRGIHLSSITEEIFNVER